MATYEDLDQRLRQIHNLFHTIDVDTDGRSRPKLEELAEEERQICTEMDRIDRDDHEQVESYRKKWDGNPALPAKIR